MQIVVGVSSSLEVDFVKSFLRDDFPVRLIQNATYDVMNNVDLALVTSGTATLETGYFQTPMIVVYKTSWLTYVIGRLLIRIKNIGLVNIVAGQKIVPELIQSNVTPQKLSARASSVLSDKALQENMRSALSVIKKKLGTSGASAKVADAIMALA